MNACCSRVWSDSGGRLARWPGKHGNKHAKYTRRHSGQTQQKSSGGSARPPRCHQRSSTPGSPGVRAATQAAGLPRSVRPDPARYHAPCDCTTSSSTTSHTCASIGATVPVSATDANCKSMADDMWDVLFCRAQFTTRAYAGQQPGHGTTWHAHAGQFIDGAPRIKLHRRQSIRRPPFWAVLEARD